MLNIFSTSVAGRTMPAATYVNDDLVQSDGEPPWVSYKGWYRAINIAFPLSHSLVKLGVAVPG